MIIERSGNEIIIKLPANTDVFGLQRILDYLSYKEATSGSEAKQSDVDTLSKEIKKSWWKENKSRLLK